MLLACHVLIPGLLDLPREQYQPHSTQWRTCTCVTEVVRTTPVWVRVGRAVVQTSIPRILCRRAHAYTQTERSSPKGLIIVFDGIGSTVQGILWGPGLVYSYYV